MTAPRRWIGRGLDVLAAAVVLVALYTFFIAPRLGPSKRIPVPPLTLATLAGPKLDLAAHHGRVVFLDFWASWCEPCKLSIPLVQHYAREHPDVDVISIDVGESEAAVRAFTRDHAMQNVALDPDSLAAGAFGVANFPTMVVVDPDGLQRAKWLGFNPAIELAMDDARERYARHHQTSFVPSAAAASPRVPTLVIEDEPASLNTIRNTPFGWQLGPLTQGYLFLVDDHGALVPDRARTVPTRANGGISADGKTITYRVRTGTWSDGAPFDAHDVAFTIDALRNPQTAVPDTSSVALVRSVRVPAPDTIVVTLSRPSAPFVSSFLTLGANDPFAILPRHIAARYSSLDRSSLDTDPVGLGPFRVKRWIRGERIEFERNPGYWRGPAASARLDVAIVPSAQTRLILARTGAIDLTEVTGFGVDVARRIPGMHISGRATNIVDYVQLNLHTPALQDARVRHAIATSIDRPTLSERVYRSTLDPTAAIQWDPRYRAPSGFPAYDPAIAKRDLAGRRITLDFAIASEWRNSANVAVQIAASLAQSGIDARIHPYSQAQFWGAKESGGILENARYDLALTSWSPALDPDRSYLFGCAAVPPGGGNSMFYCDHGYDADEARGAASYDARERAPAYRSAEGRLASALPVIPLGFERRTYAVSDRLGGFRPNPLGRDYWNAWEFTRP